MDPAVFAPFQPQQHGSGNLYRPHSPQSYSHNGAGANAGPGDSRRTPVSLHRGAGPGSAGGPNGVNGAPGSVMNAPQGSKLATYMSRGGNAGHSGGNYGPGVPIGGSGGSNPANISQLASDLNNLGLDPNTLKKLSMSGIREFIPPGPPGGGPQGSGGGGPPNNSNSTADNSGSSSPYPGSNYGSGSNPPQRLQPPHTGIGSYGSPRASPTPSGSSSISSMIPAGPQDPAMSAAAAAAAAAAGGDPNMPVHPVQYSDGGTTYFYSSDDMQPTGSEGYMGPNNGMGPGQMGPQQQVMVPSYSMYAGTPTHVANMKVRSNVPSFLAENELKLEILKRQHISQAQIDPDSGCQLPTNVDNFTQLCPLEPPPPSPMHKSQTFGYVTSVYKATNTKNGQCVVLRRIHGFRLVNTKCMVLVDQWKKLQHANLVALRQVFTTKAFHDHSMVFVYDFFPGAETLMLKHFNSPNQMAAGNAFMDPFNGGGGTLDPNGRPFAGSHKSQMIRQQAMLTGQNGLLPESVIWTYVIQMTSALRHIHSAGLACRTLDPTKILIINKTRLLLNCCGIFDVLTFDPTSSNPMAAMAHYQQEDLIALGKIVLALACNSFLAIQRENLQTSMEIVTSTYSSDMRNLIMYLLTNPNRLKTVNDLMPMMGARFYNQLDAALTHNDIIEAELSKEIESARLFRLLTKLCTVVDRAELNGDFGWAEYGDRYMLKLFRDYIFHQIMEDGRPWLDMAHVIACLNKLDAGVGEKVCLMSRDEQNVLVVNYSELRQCLEQSFAECVHSHRGPSMNPVSNSASTVSIGTYSG